MYSFLLVLLLCLVTLCSCENHYKVLGVSKHAKSKEIKKAYVKLAYKWHPDKNRDPSAPDMMAKINRAYEVLSDTDKRRHYDLLGDSDYTGSTGGYSHHSRASSHRMVSTEPTDQTDTETFMNDVIPDSETVPYLVYFFHDFCIRCEHWTDLLKDIKSDLQTIGVKMVTVDVIMNSKISMHCGVYIHEVPKIVLLLNKKSYRLKGLLNLDNLKDLIYNRLPSNKHNHSLNNALSTKTRIKSNKPAVVLISPKTTPSLNYKIVSFTYREYMDFYFVSSSAEMSQSHGHILMQLNLEEEDKRLHIYSDLEEPVAILEGDQLSRESTRSALERNKFLTLPRVNSCRLLDTLCPGGPYTRLCVLLVSNIEDDVTNEFRSLANKWNSRKFRMGYLNRNQGSTLMTAISNFSLNSDKETVDECDNGISSRPIILLHRSTSHKFEFSWYNEYCGTVDNDRRLLKLIQANLLNETATIEGCLFRTEIDSNSILSMLPPIVEDAFQIIQEFVWQHWEKIGALITLPLPLLMLACYFFMFPSLRRHPLQENRRQVNVHVVPQRHDDRPPTRPLNGNNQEQESSDDPIDDDESDHSRDHETVPDESDSVSNNTSRVNTSKDNTSRDNTSRDNNSRDDTSRDSTSRGSTSRDNISRDNISRDNISRDTISRVNTSRDNISRDDTSRDSTSRDNTSRDNTSRDNTSRDSTSKDRLATDSASNNS